MVPRTDEFTYRTSFSLPTNFRLWGDPKITNELHRIVTRAWTNKWDNEFKRRWYRLVTERTGLSGSGFALVRRGGKGSLDYEIINVVDYAEFVHRSGMRTPLVKLAVPRWVEEFSADVRAQITAFLRPYLRELVAARLRAGIAKRKRMSLVA